MNCTNADVLVVTCCSFVKCNYWGKLGKGTQDLSIVFYNCV